MHGPTPQPWAPGAGRVGRGLTLAVALGLALVGTSGTVLAQDDEPDILKVAHTANITTWDPVKSFSTEALYLANMYEPLLWVNPPGSAEPFTPALATEWESSEDGLTWTFHLRDGVTFQDGEPLTADAVVSSVEAAKARAGASFIWAPVESVEAVDPLTVAFHLSYPAPVDLIASSLYGAWIVSPKALEAAAADETYFESGIGAGTGPYMLESWVPDGEVLLTEFPDYWGGWDDVDHYEKVLVTIMPEAVDQQQALDGGQVDLAFNLPSESLDQYEANPDFTVLREPSLFDYVGFLNTQRAPLDDPLVRQALAYATPYADIIEVATAGLGTQARGPVPAGVFPYSEDTPQYQTDMEKAKDLMAEAGVDGFDMEITYAVENQYEAAFAPLLQAAYGELGVNVTLTPMPFNQQWERAKSDDLDGRQDMFLLLYWPTYSDAGSDNLWSLFHSSEAPFFNLSYWVDEQYDSLIDEAGGLTGVDRAAAQATYEEAMVRLVDQSPGIFFYDTIFPAAIPKRIAGYQYNLNYPFAQSFYPLHPAE
jgi:peptide/nickel transport system substrate-binding protein